MRTYIGPISFALLVTIAVFYFFIDEAKPTSGPHKSEDVAMDSEAKNIFLLSLKNMLLRLLKPLEFQRIKPITRPYLKVFMSLKAFSFQMQSLRRYK